MNSELLGMLICVGITIALAIVCILIGKVLSAMTDKMLPDIED